jgi:hypothetical protein
MNNERHLSLPNGATDAIALWVFGHAFDVAEFAARLALEHRFGKLVQSTSELIQRKV